MINYVTINNIRYYVEDGVTLNDKATEELDTLTFRLTNIQPLQIEPFMDVVVYFKNNTSKSFIVNTWIDEVATFSGLKNYTISCISETKKLERVALPNMTITQPLGLTDANKRTYDIYIERIMKYVNKIYPDLTLNYNLKTKLSNIIAVEEQFNSPTSKEYYNSILEKITSIVKVENGVIDCFDLSKKGNAIDERKILFTNNAQTIEEYYSDIVTDVQGVQSEDATIITELVGVRSPENAVVTYDNAVVQLSHNINFLKEVIVWAKIKVNGTEKIQGYRIYGGDYHLIKEKSEYDLLKISNKLSDFSSDIKRNNLYYTRGSNKIEGLSYNEKTWLVGLSSVLTAIESIITKINSENNFTAIFDGDIRDLKFQVTYSAIDDVSTKFEKDTTTKSVIRDNQTDSYVDLDKFAKAQQEKINRLGNPILEINARYNDLSEVPALMDYIDDYVLAEREIVYHRHYIDFKGVLYKDYVKKNLFYGVNAKKRSYNLMLDNEAVTRKELTKLTYEFSYTDKETATTKNTQRYLLGKLASTNAVLNETSSALLEGAWYFNDKITNVAFNVPDYDETSEEALVKGEFYYKTSYEGQVNYIRLYQIGFSYDNVAGSYRITYYPNDYDKFVAYESNSWNHENYRTLEVVNYFNINDAYIGQNNFYKTIKSNATKTQSGKVSIPLDEYNMTSLDFQPLQIVACKSNLSNGNQLNYKLEPDVRKANKSVTINLKWYDNINVGMKFDGIKTTSIIDLVNAKGGYGQQYVTYTDDNGELDSINLRLYDYYDYNIAEDSFDAVDNYPELDSLALLSLNSSYKVLDLTLERYKDNREILNETIQIDFKTEEGIYIADRFTDMLPFFKKYKQYLYIWTSNEKYNKYNYNVVLENAYQHIDNLEVNYNDVIDFLQNHNAFNRIMLYNNNVDLSNVNSWALADANGNVYIAVNKRETDSVIPTTIYLNKKGE
jgi:hypothetical protein